MVALKKLFNAEKDRSPTPIDVPNAPSSRLARHGSNGSSFEKFWKEVDQWDGQFRSPVSTSSSEKSDAPGALTAGGRRHVDLLEALFSSHRYRMQTKALSPTLPYNEDIAERNIKGLGRKLVKANTYAHSASSAFHENVAERNTTSGRSSASSWRRVSNRSSLVTAAGSGDSWPSTIEDSKPSPSSHKLTGDKGDDVGKLASKSQGDLRSIFGPQGPSFPPGPLQSHPVIHARRSSPTLLACETGMPKEAMANAAGRHLGLPPAYRRRETPLPDSPTLPIQLNHGQDPNGNEIIPRDIPYLSIRDSKMATSSASSVVSSRSAGKKAKEPPVNAELTHMGKETTKFALRPIPPPTQADSERHNLSIAEVVNNPSQLPRSPSHSHVPDSICRIEKNIHSIKQPFVSIQTAESEASIESLEDTIVREINSHEAFQRVPSPDTEPLFTPSATEDVWSIQGQRAPRSSNSRLGRSISVKENQLARLITRGSLRKHARGPEASKSPSTNVQVANYGEPVRRHSSESSRRRHTDAPFPSRELLDSVSSTGLQGKNVNGPAQRYYRQASCVSVNPRVAPDSFIGRVNNSRLSADFPYHSGSEPPRAPNSIYYMRAHSMETSRDSRASFSTQDEDEVIQLPSVDTPRLHVHGVDENNVTYFIDNTTPDNAYRLMNWPQRRRGSIRQQRLGHNGFE